MTVMPVRRFKGTLYVPDQLILCLWLYVAFHIIRKNDLSNLLPIAAWSAEHCHTSDSFFPSPLYPLDYKTIFYIFRLKTIFS